MPHTTSPEVIDFISQFLGSQSVPAYEKIAQGTRVLTNAEFNLYFHHRPMTEVNKKIQLTKTNSFFYESPFTSFDAYQIVRDKEIPDLINKRKFYREKLLCLDKIYPLKDKNYYNILICLLAILLKKLEAHDKFLLMQAAVHIDPEYEDVIQQELSQDEINIVISQFDAIVSVLADNLFEAIIQTSITANPKFYADLFTQLNAISSEIYSWLSLLFKNYLVNEPVNEKAIFDECFKLFQLKNEYVLDTGFDSTTILNIKKEQHIWKSIQNQTFAVKLSIIKKYLYNDVLNDALMLKFAIHLNQESEAHQQDIDFIILKHQFLKRVKKDSFYLSETEAYIEKNQANLHARELPSPSAAHFYDSNIAFIERSFPQPRYKDKEKKHFTAIFSDHKYIAQHNNFITSAEAWKFDLSPQQFPLLALRLHYNGALISPNILAVWNSFLDENSLYDSDFFAYQANIQLFEKVREVYDNELTTDIILQNPARYLNLAAGLCVYVMTLAQIESSPVGIFSRIHFSTESQWAIELYANILDLVAYTEDKLEMQFDNIVKFINLKIDTPCVLPKKPAIFDDVINYKLSEFYLENPEINFNLQQKLIHDFMHMYINSFEREMVPIRLEAAKFDYTQLPSTCLIWVSFWLNHDAYLTPVFATSIQKYHIEKASQDFSINFLIETRYLTHTGNTPSERNLNLAACFTENLYLAYIHANENKIWQSKNEARSCYLNFMLNQEFPLVIYHSMNNSAIFLRKNYEDNSKKIWPFAMSSEAVAAEQNHLASINKMLKKVLCELSHNDYLGILLKDVCKAIDENQFNTNYLTTNYYHNYLINLKDNLLALQKWKTEQILNIEMNSQNKLFNNSNETIAVMLQVSSSTFLGVLFPEEDNKSAPNIYIIPTEEKAEINKTNEENHDELTNSLRSLRTLNS